jgi:serine/threonine protein kinase
MAPERRKGLQKDYKLDDIFAAGIILFQMLAIKHPFEIDEAKDIVKNLESHE